MNEENPETNPDKPGDFNQGDNPGHSEKTGRKSRPDVRYVPVEYLPQMQDDDDEIDLMALIRTVWENRTVIYKTIVVFILIGLLVALGSAEEYSSQVRLLPEARQATSLSGLGSLARQFGVSTGPVSAEDGIPPSLYPDVTNSLVVMERLMAFDVTLPGEGRKIPLREYFEEHQSPSLLATVQKYTVRLPLTILGGIRRLFSGDPADNITLLDRELEGEAGIHRIIQMSKDEWELVRNLRDRVSTQTDEMSGVVTVGVKMPDPLIAAEVANHVVTLLSEYIINYRTEKARASLEQIETLTTEIRQQYETAQMNLARFHDENPGQLTAMAATREQHLQSEYSLNYNLYNSMTERRAEAQIQLQEETPVLSVLEPAALPDQRSSPKRTQIMIISTLLGGVLGVGLIFGRQLWLDMKGKISEQNS